MRVVRHEGQEGIAATRAHALRLARGEFIGLLDSDDLWLPGKVRPQVELLTAEPAVGLTHADFEAFDSDTGERVPWDPHWNLGDDQLVELVRQGCFVMTGTTLIRRAAIETRGIGFVALDYASYDDYLLYLTIALDWELAYEPRTVMRYRRHHGNLTNVLFAEDLARARLNLLAEFLRRFPEAGDRLGPEHRRTVARLLVRSARNDFAHHPARAAGSALSGFGRDPAAALREFAGMLRNLTARVT
jgi:glycosyltransferase involved in cell wall biosynthesis